MTTFFNMVVTNSCWIGYIPKDLPTGSPELNLIEVRWLWIDPQADRQVMS